MLPFLPNGSSEKTRASEPTTVSALISAETTVEADIRLFLPLSRPKTINASMEPGIWRWEEVSATAHCHPI